MVQILEQFDGINPATDRDRMAHPSWLVTSTETEKSISEGLPPFVHWVSRSGFLGGSPRRRRADIDCVAGVLAEEIFLDIGAQSLQGCPEAVALRLMGPLSSAKRSWLGLHVVGALVTTNDDTVRRPITTLQGVESGDTVLVENMTMAGMRFCGSIRGLR